MNNKCNPMTKWQIFDVRHTHIVFSLLDWHIGKGCGICVVQIIWKSFYRRKGKREKNRKNEKKKKKEKRKDKLKSTSAMTRGKHSWIVWMWNNIYIHIDSAWCDLYPVLYRLSYDWKYKMCQNGIETMELRSFRLKE